MPQPTLLIITQVYPPDPASVGQYLADVAAEMVRRGYRVVVYTSATGYDNPSEVYAPFEMRAGVEVHRLPLSSLGKSSIATRVVGQGLFLAQATWRGLFTRHLCAMLVSTSPPFCGVAGVVVSALRGVPLKYWLMDLNPDQVVAMGLMARDALAVRVFDLWNKGILAWATDIVVLDRFMLERVCRKLDVRAKATILPPWPQGDLIEKVAASDNPFRQQHVPAGKFVLMYSGNHSKASPLATILDAAERLQDDPRLLVMCVGGGQGKREVDDRIARGARNIVSLPYQPLDQIKYSLSAGDVHLVALGDPMVGIIHPCKVYSAMAASRPILYVGPSPSHISDWIERCRIGWQVRHGDVDAAATAIREILETPRQMLEDMGSRANEVMREHLDQKKMLNQFGDIVERGLQTARIGRCE